MSRVNIQPQAYVDAEQASAWYEAQRFGLGIEFVLLRRFPYAVYFVDEGEFIEVFAILHQQQEPAVWQTRVS